MKNILVFGGSGFLGKALIKRLQQAGLERVRCFDLLAHPDLTVDSIVGDMRSPKQVAQACAGVDTVFQSASLVDWGLRSREKLYAVNVQGNRNVLEACQQQGVQRLIYTSSVDVVFDGKPIVNGDETLPYASRHLDDYGHTKALAEQDALRAHQEGGLQTCALRAAGIYGPDDPHRFPPVLELARHGKMVALGNGQARFNHIYVENLAEAHLRAAQALQPGSPVGGQAYFVTDYEPSNFYTFVSSYLRALGLPVPERRIPTGLAYGAALLAESLSRLGIGPTPPLLTRYTVLATCADFYFSGAKARLDLGYQPQISPEQAFQKTLDWLKTYLDETRPPHTDAGAQRQ